MAFLKNALMCFFIESHIINHDCLPILMLLYIMLFIMLFAALYNAVCLYYAFFLFWPLIFIFMFCLGLLSHSLFISCINLHHAQCF